MILSLIDTMQIQDYIFSTNKLKQIIGASYNVKNLIENYIIKVLNKLEFKGNNNWFEDRNKVSIVSEKNNYEIIFLGGGNATIIFDTIENAKMFTKEWTLKVLKKAPNLNVAVSHTEFSDINKIKEIYLEAKTKLSENKKKKNTLLRFETIPIMHRCNSTGLRATDISTEEEEEDIKYISDIVEKKISKIKSAQSDLANKFELNQKKIPNNIDDLVEQDGFNYISIVHADGNNIGLKLKNIIQNIDSGEDYIVKLRNFSIFLEEVNVKAIKSTIKYIIDYANSDENDFYPIRPIIYGGDDLTIVCRGDLGLIFAEKYAEYFKEISCNDIYKVYFGDKGLSSCIGISIVHSNHPFRKAYALAEDLIKNAKKFVKLNHENEEIFGLDWHIAISSNLDSLSDIRKSFYKYEDNVLTMKPYIIDKKNDSYFNSFTKFIESLKILNLIPQSKYKDLIKIITTSNEKMEQYLKIEASEYVDQYEKIKKIFSLYNSSIYYKHFDPEKNKNIFKTPIIDLIESVKFYPLSLKKLTGGNDE